MTLTRSSLSELLEPGLKAIFGDTYDQWDPEYSRFMDIEQSKKASEEYQELAGFGLVPTKTEGGTTTYDDAIQGNKETTTNLTYSLGFKVTREMMDDDLYRKIQAMPKSLAISIAQTVETEAALILDRAFNSSYTGLDSVELCSRVHTLPGGGTFANEPATAADLSMTSYEQATIDIAALVDGQNMKRKAMPRMLITSKNFEATAKRILQSTTDPETAERSINPFNNTVKHMTSHYVTDTDAWFIRTNVPGLFCQKRVWPAEMRKDNEFDSDVAKFKTYFRLAFSWYDPRAIYGSPGA
jgi:hypothetical protein